MVAFVGFATRSDAVERETDKKQLQNITKEESENGSCNFLASATEF